MIARVCERTRRAHEISRTRYRVVNKKRPVAVVSTKQLGADFATSVGTEYVSDLHFARSSVRRVYAARCRLVPAAAAETIACVYNRITRSRVRLVFVKCGRRRRPLRRVRSPTAARVYRCDSTNTTRAPRDYLPSAWVRIEFSSSYAITYARGTSGK